MDVQHAEALSEFFDGEDVDPALLAESLAQPGAAGLLEGFAAMRARTRSGPRPAPGVLDAIAATMQRAAARRRWRNRVGVLGLGAALMVVAAGVGFRLASVGDRRGPHPTTTPVAQTVPAPAALSHAAVPTRAAPAPAAREGQPPVVGSLRLRLGEWAETAGAAGEGQR